MDRAWLPPQLPLRPPRPRHHARARWPRCQRRQVSRHAAGPRDQPRSRADRRGPRPLSDRGGVGSSPRGSRRLDPRPQDYDGPGPTRRRPDDRRGQRSLHRHSVARLGPLPDRIPAERRESVLERRDRFHWRRLHRLVSLGADRRRGSGDGPPRQESSWESRRPLRLRRHGPRAAVQRPRTVHEPLEHGDNHLRGDHWQRDARHRLADADRRGDLQRRHGKRFREVRSRDAGPDRHRRPLPRAPLAQGPECAVYRPWVSVSKKMFQSDWPRRRTCSRISRSVCGMSIPRR